MSSVPLTWPCTLCCRPTPMWCSCCKNAWYCTTEHKPCLCNVDLHATYILFRTGHTIEENAFLLHMLRATMSLWFHHLLSSNLAWLLCLLYCFVRKKVHMALPMLFASFPSDWIPERSRIIAFQCCEPQCPSMDTCPQPVINFPDGQAESIIVAHGLNDRTDSYTIPSSCGIPRLHCC